MTFDAQWVALVVFVSLRLGALLMLTPLFTQLRAPVTFRVLLVLALAACVSAGLPTAARPAPVADPVLFAVGALSEVLLGALLAFGLHCAFAALHLAAKVIDLQMGLGVGGIFDPATRSQQSPLYLGLQWLAVLVFLSIDGHHALLRGIAYSLERVPAGVPFIGYAGDEVVRMFGAVFSMGVLVGAPVMAAMLLLEGGLAVVSKALPQMNVFFVSMPIKVLLGLGMLALLSRQLAPLMQRGYAAVFDYWQRVLG